MPFRGYLLQLTLMFLSSCLEPLGNLPIFLLFPNLPAPTPVIRTTTTPGFTGDGPWANSLHNPHPLPSLHSGPRSCRLQGSPLIGGELQLEGMQSLLKEICGGKWQCRPFISHTPGGPLALLPHAPQWQPLSCKGRAITASWGLCSYGLCGIWPHHLHLVFSFLFIPL